MIETVYEDEYLLVVDKPQGIATTPGKIEDLCTAVFSQMPEISGVKGFNVSEGGLLNRLDNETGGLVLFSKTDESFKYYSKILKECKVKKEYYAVVTGKPDKDKGIITAPISHHPKNKSKMCIFKPGNSGMKPQEAVTEWELLKSFNSHSLIKAVIYKGVRHQIRVHLASIKIPIAGDKLYNSSGLDYKNHLLYCYAVTIPLYKSNILKRIEIEPLAKILQNYRIFA